MYHWCSSIAVLLVYGITTAKLALADPPGFLTLSCGGSTSFADSSNISWVPDSSYITTGNATVANFVRDDGSTTRVSLRFFPNPRPRRKCYRLPLRNASLALVRARFVYKNYDGMDRPPSFAVSLATATATIVNLTQSDPWEEEFIWRVTKQTLPFCLHAIRDGGVPVISSLEVRPLPVGAYETGSEEFASALLRKRFRINCGYVDNEALRYPFDYYDRMWDADQKFTPSRLSAGFHIPLPLNVSGLRERPPVSVLQTARVLARRNVLSYDFPLDKIGDYHVVLYFAGIMPVSSSFDVLINNDLVRSDFNVKHAEASSIYYLGKSIHRVNIMFRNVSFYPQVNGIEIYEIIKMPQESSSTTVAALQVIQQSTGFDFEWQDDPCSPTPWEHIRCNGSLVTSLELYNMELRAISPTFGDMLDLKKLDLHNTSLFGEIMNLGSLQKLEILNLSFNKLTSFGSDFDTMLSLQILLKANQS